MKRFARFAGVGLPAALLLAGISCSPAAAQGPAVVVPIVVDTAVPIIINAVKPNPPSGLGKFEGYVMNANTAQITLRAKGNDLGIQTFTLSEEAATKMQAIIDKGGFQYGDKVTIYYDPTSQKAMKFKGKPSRPI